MKWVSEQALTTGAYYAFTELFLKKIPGLMKDVFVDCIGTRGKVPGLACGDGK